MATNGRKSGFVDNTGKTSSGQKEDSGRFLQVAREEYKGKVYITVGWCFEGKDGKVIHEKGKQVWMQVDEFKRLFEDGLTPAYKAVK